MRSSGDRPSSSRYYRPPTSFRVVLGPRRLRLDKEEDWEIKKIVDKRRVAKGNEYKVRWRDTWLPESEVGKAQELLREFEAKGRVGHGRKQGRPVRTGRV